jgi:drug/metabolite transporter (DMT)-like permease
MNVFLIFDIAALVLVLVVAYFMMRLKRVEEEKFHNSIYSLLAGLFFLLVYFALNIVSYFVTTNMVSYTSSLVVLPLASIFFLVSVFIPSE